MKKKLQNLETKRKSILVFYILAIALFLSGIVSVVYYFLEPTREANPLIHSGGIYTYDFSADVNMAYTSSEKLINGKGCQIIE